MILYSALFAGLLAASIIACVNFANKKTPLFFKLILLGVLTLLLGRFYEFITVLLFNALYSSFHVGKLAMIGGNLFFFTAYYGTMDRILDDGNEKNKKYRLLAFIVPAVYLLSFMALPIIKKTYFVEYAASLAVCISGLPAAYYCFKYCIFPMDDMMMIKKLRKFNIYTLIVIFFTNMELMTLLMSVWEEFYAFIWVFGDFILSVIYILQMTSLVKGYKKWTVLF